MGKRPTLSILRWIAFAVPGGTLALFLFVLRIFAPQHHRTWWGFIIEAGGILLGAYLFSTAVFSQLKKGEEHILRSNSQLQALHEATLSITGDLSLDVVLQNLVERARELVSAQYCALWVLPDGGAGQPRFLSAGLPREMEACIGRMPEGKGLLAALLAIGRPLRVQEILKHPAFSGFPPGHPIMHTFLGVPIISRRRVLGAIYLAEKHGAPIFSAEDEEVVTRLAHQAAAAITNARLYQETLQATERVERLIQGSQDAIVVLDVAGRVELWNRGAEVLYGLTPEQAKLEPLPFLSPANRHRALNQLQEVNAGGRMMSAEALHRHASGRQIPALISLSPVAAGEGEPARILMIAKDLSDQKRLEAQRRRLALLEERERIGMDLHDGAIQSLYAVGLGLEAVRRRLPSDLSDLANGLGEAKTDLNQVIQDLRAYILDHRQHSLVKHGLVQGMQELVDRLREEGDLQVELALSRDNEPHPDVTGHLLYIAAEALSNALRHSGASIVSVRLQVSGGTAVLIIRDNGCGFDAATTNIRGRLGLRNMRARAQLLGGECFIRSKPGEGTEVLVQGSTEGGEEV